MCYQSGGVESKKLETVEAAQKRKTAKKQLFDSVGKIGVAAHAVNSGYAIVGDANRPRAGVVPCPL